MDERNVLRKREQALREWFTRNCDPALRDVDGLDIGWGGVQRWATARMPAPMKGPHLDFACGYGTFLAQMGWRFPDARLVGLNIDYDGPHAIIKELLGQAEVSAGLVWADARQMPFADSVFASGSCFLGLQDIEIGFGQSGVRETLAEAVRVVSAGGTLVLLDEYTFERLDALLDGLPVAVIDRAERPLEVRWDRQVAERAIALYAEGWVAQMRLTEPAEKREIYTHVHARMQLDMERQLHDQGYYVPFGPVRMLVLKRVNN